MKCSLFLLILLSLCTAPSLIYNSTMTLSNLKGHPSKEKFIKTWGSIENYYNHCIKILNKGDIEYLVSTADSAGLLYFTVIIENDVIIVPVLAQDLSKGRSPFYIFNGHEIIK